MKFHVLTLAALFATALAVPYGGSSEGGSGGTTGGNTPYDPCAGALYSNALCCSGDVLGLVDLSCVAGMCFSFFFSFYSLSSSSFLSASTHTDNQTVPTTPTSGPNFKSICAASGTQPKCCVLPIVCLCFYVFLFLLLSHHDTDIYTLILTHVESLVSLPFAPTRLAPRKGCLSKTAPIPAIPEQLSAWCSTWPDWLKTDIRLIRWNLTNQKRAVHMG